MRPEKEAVRTFYETFGWIRVQEGLYKDSLLFGDLRHVVVDHFHDLYRRAKRALPSQGCYLLDVGSGPVAYPWTVQYSEGYRHRVCVDISRAALHEARRMLGAGSFYVVGDLVSLPFREGSFDGIVAAHVLYHVPKDEQETAVRELHRTLAQGGRCVILYARPSSPVSRFTRRFHPRRLASKIPGVRPLWRAFSGAGREPGGAPPRAQIDPVPYLYFHAHDYPWFKTTFPADWKLSVRPWSMVDVAFTKAFLPDNHVGAFLLRVIFGFEDKFPRLALRLGCYPMVVIQKG